MSAIVFEHVPVEELPEQWRLRLAAVGGERVTVHIESEGSLEAAPLSTNPMFGLWRERTDIADVDGYIRDVRATRYPVDKLPPEQSE